MSYVRAQYHIVYATKGRQPWLTAEIQAWLMSRLPLIAPKYGGSIDYVGCVENHIHHIGNIKTSVAHDTFVGQIKGATSREINLCFSPSPTFAWQRGFGLFTLNPDDMTRAIDYVLNQHQHHARNHLWTDFERTTEPPPGEF